MLVHPPQVDGQRPDGTVLAPRQHTRPRIVPGHPHFTARRPCQRHGTLAVPAALAAPPEQRAPAHLVPDREEHENNDHANQRNAHPGTSWRAELLRRGVGSVRGDNPRRSSCPNKASLPRRDFLQSNTAMPVPEQPGSGDASTGISPVPGRIERVDIRSTTRSTAPNASVRFTLFSWEPPIGIEPMTYALRGARAAAAHALAAPIARAIARMALAALGLSGDPVHEPVHARDPASPHPATVRKRC